MLAEQYGQFVEATRSSVEVAGGIGALVEPREKASQVVVGLTAAAQSAIWPLRLDPPDAKDTPAVEVGGFVTQRALLFGLQRARGAPRSLERRVELHQRVGNFRHLRQLAIIT